MKRIFFFYFIFTLSPFSFAKQNKIDSLISILKTAKEDTNKVNALNALGRELMHNNPDTAILLCTNALELSEIVKWQKGIANSNHNLGEFNYRKGKYIQSLAHYQKALSLRERQNDQNGIAATLGNIGIVHDEQGDYPKALEYYFRALKMDEELRNKNGIARHLSNIGIVYWKQGDYPKALGYYFRALQMKEELGEKNSIASTLGNIGLVYSDQGDYPKALDYYFMALKMDEELGNKNHIAIRLGNIGIIYAGQADDPKVYPVERDSLFNRALDYFFRALKMDEELGNKNGIARHLCNIGNVYKDQGEAHPNPSQRDGFLNKALASPAEAFYAKALDYYFRALKMEEELGNKYGIAINLGNIGSLYTATGKFAEAEKYLDSALTISTEIDALNIIKDHQQYLSHLYDTLAGSSIPIISGQSSKYYKLAFEHYKKYITARDTINSEENQKKQVRTEMNYEFEKKEAAARAEQDKKDAVAAAESKRQRLFLWLVAAVAAAAAVIAAVIFRSYRQKKKANRQLAEKNFIIENQKKIVEEKNKNITDSIRYAQNIQNAILPREAEMNKVLPEHFIFFQPKDIVSGDFYWFHALPPTSHEDGGTRGVVAVCDCTGHGVPGAFVSMIGNDLLNKIIIEKCLENPGEILTELNNGVKSVFTSKETGQQVKDGMDIALCTFDKGLKTLVFAGANNPLILIQNGELSVIKGDRTAIGGDTDINYAFKEHKIKLKKGDTLYMFSDGYKDQFGGNTGDSSALAGERSRTTLTVNGEYGEGKKFMMKQFKNLLLSIHDKTMQEQKEIISKTIADWKGNLAQTDDVCVIGVRV